MVFEDMTVRGCPEMTSSWIEGFSEHSSACAGRERRGRYETHETEAETGGLQPKSRMVVDPGAEAT